MSPKLFSWRNKSPVFDFDTSAARLVIVVDIRFRAVAASPKWRILTALHRELSRLTAGGVYFLTCRDAAKAVPGMSHQTAYNINLALVHFGVIKIVRVGESGPNGKRASEFRYLLSQSDDSEQDDGGLVL
jgi:hypothetical protein